MDSMTRDIVNYILHGRQGLPEWLTKKKSMELCVDLWEILARTGTGKASTEAAKHYKKQGYNPPFGCWACAYDEKAIEKDAEAPSCSHCPVIKAFGFKTYKSWLKATGKKEKSKEDDWTAEYPCISYGSPYRSWEEACSKTEKQKYAKSLLRRFKTIAAGKTPTWRTK